MYACVDASAAACVPSLTAVVSSSAAGFAVDTATQSLGGAPSNKTISVLAFVARVVSGFNVVIVWQLLRPIDRRQGVVG